MVLVIVYRINCDHFYSFLAHILRVRVERQKDVLKKETTSGHGIEGRK